MITDRNYVSSHISRDEILRYAGVKESTPELSDLLEDVLAEAEGQIACRVVWTDFPVTDGPDGLDLGFARCGSQCLRRHLNGCERIVVFAATLGIGPDRLIARYSRVSPSRALMFQALGAERIEWLCDTFCEELRRTAAEQGFRTGARFSPGYGDLPLDLQQDIFRVLDCSRRIGLTLNESLLMSPSKSVTAIVGIGKYPADAGTPGCAGCGKTDCVFRRSL